MDTKIFIMSIMLAFLPQYAYSRSDLKYVAINKGCAELSGNDLDTSVMSHVFDISGSELQRICLDTLGAFAPVYCNRLDVTVVCDRCAVGFIQSGNVVGDVASHIVFCFEDETVVVNRAILDAYESFFLEIPLDIVELFVLYATKHSVDDAYVNAGVFHLLRTMIIANVFHYVPLEIHPAYYGRVWIRESLRSVDPAHDFLLLKSFLYDHYIIGCSSGYLMSSMRDFVEYSKTLSTEDDIYVVEKDIFLDLIEMAALATFPSLAPRLPADYVRQTWSGGILCPYYYEAIRKKGIAVQGLQ